MLREHSKSPKDRTGRVHNTLRHLLVVCRILCAKMVGVTSGDDFLPPVDSCSD